MASPDKTVIIEFVKVGAYVKVSAIDPTTRVEVLLSAILQFRKRP